MITVGVDLAAEAAGTGLAVLEWDGSGARVIELAVGVEDPPLVAAVLGADRAGIDCPFGWPDAFIDVVVAHRDGQLEAPGSSGRPWRRTLANRVTDLAVHERTGLAPLSVSADRIGHTTFRWAAIAATLAGRGADLRRDGRGLVAEVYPAAALKQWGLRFRGYKGMTNRQARDELVDDLLGMAPWLDLAGSEPLVRTVDHALDATLCALVARAVALGATAGPSDGAQAATAMTEGWIHVPTGPLGGLPG